MENSLRLEPNNVYALTEIIKLAAYQKDTEQATLLTEQALKAHPNNIEVLRLYFEFHKNEAGLEVITKVQKSNPDNVKYGILLAEALMQLDQFRQASSILAAYKLSGRTPKRYWQLALMANAKQPDAKDVYSILDKWFKNNPYHIEPAFLLANYWTSKRSPDRALSVLDKAFKKHPNNLMINLVKMQVLLDSGRIADAKELFKSLEKFDVNDDLKAGIEGRILLLERNFVGAIPKLQQQYKARPTSNNATFLAFALEGNNQKSQAIELLEQFSDKENIENRINSRVSLSLANMYLAEHQDKAIVEYERLIKASPKNIVALNNLSWLYMEDKKYSQAQKYSKQAYALNSTIPNVVDTYAQALLKSGQKAEALVKAKEAYELSKGKDIDIGLNFVEALLANKNKDEARSILNGITGVTAVQIEKKKRLSE